MKNASIDLITVAYVYSFTNPYVCLYVHTYRTKTINKQKKLYSCTNKLTCIFRQYYFFICAFDRTNIDVGRIVAKQIFLFWLLLSLLTADVMQQKSIAKENNLKMKNCQRIAIVILHFINFRRLLTLKKQNSQS